MKTKYTLIFSLTYLIALSARSATIPVTSTADSGAGTIRAALAAAVDGDTIDATGVSGTILLTSGELFIGKSVSIAGPGPARLALDGNHSTRAFHVGSNAIVTISSLAVSNAITDLNGGLFIGGGVLNDHATLIVSNCIISGNAANAGGGICNDGRSGVAKLTILGSVIAANSNYNGLGGGILNDGLGGNATLTLSNCVVTGNAAQFGGGGIANLGAAGSATLLVVNSDVSANSGGQGAPGFGGGGICNLCRNGGEANALIIGTSVRQNSVRFQQGGGGLLNSGTDAGSVTMRIVNSTVSGNSTDAAGNGIFNDGRVGSAVLRVANSTISDDATNLAVSIFNDGRFGGTATVDLGSTILNTGPTGLTVVILDGTVNSLGYNLSSDGAGGFLTNSTDQIDTDPLIGPLQDNGGLTFTHALLPGSPAIDHGKNFTTLQTDQRGVPFARTYDDPLVPNAFQGDGTDIGSYEVQLKTPAERLADLITFVQGLNLPSGTANSLTVKLQAARDALVSGNSQATCGSLGAFVNEVNAQKGKKLTVAQADLLVTRVKTIQTALNCQ